MYRAELTWVRVMASALPLTRLPESFPLLEGVEQALRTFAPNHRAVREWVEREDDR